MELEQLLIEKSEVHETLEKSEQMAMNLEAEKKKLQDEIKQVIMSFFKVVQVEMF
jgi:hypothetical protein